MNEEKYANQLLVWKSWVQELIAENDLLQEELKKCRATLAIQEGKA